MNTRYRTNLDEAVRFVQSLNSNPLMTDAPPPAVGERIRFYPFGRSGVHFELEVCSVTHCVIDDPGRLYPAIEHEVELHMPSYYDSMSIKEWSDWFKRHIK